LLLYAEVTVAVQSRPCHLAFVGVQIIHSLADGKRTLWRESAP